MSARLCVAVAIAALTFAGAGSAGAADLYGDNYYPPQDAPYYGEGEREYSDRYDGDRGRYDDEGSRDRYSEREESYEYQYRGSTKDGGAYVPPSRFAYRDYGRSGSCASRWQIRSRLHDEGWVNIRPLDRQGGATLLRARRAESGRVFTLRVDRCSGEVVDARPYFLRTFGAYAPRPWERGRPY